MKTTLTFHIGAEAKEKLREDARQMGLDMSNYVRLLIYRELKMEEQTA